MDAGIATDDNLKFLKENGYDWICISKKARVAPPDRAPDSTLHTKAKHLVEAWRISDKDADELQLYARSEGRRQTEASILAGSGANWRPNCNICMMAFPCLDG